jgi:hypothetical protein
MSETALCEVIGCSGVAAWVREANLDPIHEDYLCCVCWARLYDREPRQAGYYALRLQDRSLSSSNHPGYFCTTPASVKSG